jgi:hypothetical protein
MGIGSVTVVPSEDEADLRRRQDSSNRGLNTLLILRQRGRDHRRDHQHRGSRDRARPNLRSRILPLEHRQDLQHHRRGRELSESKKPRRIKLFAEAGGRTTWLISAPEEETSLSLQEGLAGTSTSQGRAKASSRSSKSDIPTRSVGNEE